MVEGRKDGETVGGTVGAKVSCSFIAERRNAVKFKVPKPVNGSLEDKTEK
jgi:hypothetical protein